MKKIGYISVYRDGTGYGNAAIAMIKAIHKTGHTVVPIWMTLSQIPAKDDELVSSLEKNTLDNFDVIIQQSLPDTFVRIEGVKNIGYFFYETDSFLSSGWKNGCDIMDEIWVTTEAQKEACVNSGVKEDKIKIIDQPKEIFDTNERMDFSEFGIEDAFKFYTISDYSNKKNISALICSFLCEFSIHDNVALVIKSYLSSQTLDHSMEFIKGTIAEIKKQIGKPDWAYPRIAIITKMMTDEGIACLENACDCFVSASRGEGEGLPMVQAAMRKKPVIAPNISGINKNFINKELLVKGMARKRVFGMQNGAYYAPNENWYDPSTSEIAEKMRYVLEHPNEVKAICEENYKFVSENTTIEACSKKIKELL